MSQEENNTNNIMMIMKSEDGTEFEVSREVASMCKTFESIMEEDDDMTDTELSCPSVSTKILAKVVEYCKYYKNELEMDNIDGETPFPPDKQELSDIVTQEWYVTFIHTLENKTLFHLVEAANYLNIPPLLDLALLEVATRIQGLSMEELRTRFQLLAPAAVEA